MTNLWYFLIFPRKKDLTFNATCLITKIYLYNFDPLKPHFYIVKLGFSGVYIIFLISAQNKDCGYSLEPPRRGGSNKYPQSMFWAQIWKNIRIFLSENFHFLVAKFSVYLNKHVFVMILETICMKCQILFCGIFSYFSQKTEFDIWSKLSPLLGRWFTWNAKSYFL